MPTTAPSPATPLVKRYPRDVIYENLGFAQALIRSMLAAMKSGDPQSTQYRCSMEIAEESLAINDWLHTPLAGR